jgi:hypothetical protein
VIGVVARGLGCRLGHVLTLFRRSVPLHARTMIDLAGCAHPDLVRAVAWSGGWCGWRRRGALVVVLVAGGAEVVV